MYITLKLAKTQKQKPTWNVALGTITGIDPKQAKFVQNINHKAIRTWQNWQMTKMTNDKNAQSKTKQVISIRTKTSTQEFWPKRKSTHQLSSATLDTNPSRASVLCISHLFLPASCREQNQHPSPLPPIGSFSLLEEASYIRHIHVCLHCLCWKSSKCCPITCQTGNTSFSRPSSKCILAPGAKFLGFGGEFWLPSRVTHYVTKHLS